MRRMWGWDRSVCQQNQEHIKQHVNRSINNPGQTLRVLRTGAKLPELVSSFTEWRPRNPETFVAGLRARLPVLFADSEMAEAALSMKTYPPGQTDRNATMASETAFQSKTSLASPERILKFVSRMPPANLKHVREQ